MRRRQVADWSAGVLAAIVLVVGCLMVVKPALDHWDSVWSADPFAVGTTTKRVARAEGSRPAVQTTATERESAAERVLDSSGMLALRLILVSAAAFLAAAVLQRVILGEYTLRLARAPASDSVGGSEPVIQATVPDTDGAVPDADDSADEPAVSPNGPTAPDIGPSLAPPIARLIASRRAELGLSQRELAKKAGISHTVVSRIEQGEHTPNRRTLERLADALRAAR